MKICIAGAGAIGGLIGARLAGSGKCAVSALARGATLAALQAHGWRLREGGRETAMPIRAVADAASLGPQDLVVVAVKGPSLAGLAPALAPLIGPDTALLAAMNGIPWWFMPNPPLDSVDPGGAIATVLPVRQSLGCVVHAAASVAEPGVVEHRMGNGLIIGEPEGGTSPRAEKIAEILRAGGFDVTLSEAIRRDVWYKLWGNMTINPVSALTGATADKILDDPLVRDFISKAMREAQAIGAKIGCPIDQTPQDRHAITRKLGAFKTSMLQDAEAGRPLEIDALIGAVREIGARVGVETPTTDAIFGLARVFASRLI
jgi:2-dehydropantoate 2-reductase